MRNIVSKDTISPPELLFSATNSLVAEQLDFFRSVRKKEDISDAEIATWITDNDNSSFIQLMMQMCHVDKEFHDFNCTPVLEFHWRSVIKAYVTELSLMVSHSEQTASNKKTKLDYDFDIAEDADFVDVAIGLHCYAMAISLDKCRRMHSYESYLTLGIQHQSIHALHELLTHYYEQLDTLLSVNLVQDKRFTTILNELVKLSPDCARIAKSYGAHGQTLLIEHFARLAFYTKAYGLEHTGDKYYHAQQACYEALAARERLQGHTDDLDAFASLNQGYDISAHPAPTYAVNIYNAVRSATSMKGVADNPFAFIPPSSLTQKEILEGLECYLQARSTDKLAHPHDYIRQLHKAIAHQSIHALHELLHHYYSQLHTINSQPVTQLSSLLMIAYTQKISRLANDCKRICMMHGHFGQQLLTEYYETLTKQLTRLKPMLKDEALSAALDKIFHLKAATYVAAKHAIESKGRSDRLDAYASLNNSLPIRLDPARTLQSLKPEVSKKTAADKVQSVAGITALNARRANIFNRRPHSSPPQASARPRQSPGCRDNAYAKFQSAGSRRH